MRVWLFGSKQVKDRITAREADICSKCEIRELFVKFCQKQFKHVTQEPPTPPPASPCEFRKIKPGEPLGLIMED